MTTLHRCTCCGFTFKSSRAFEAHECVKALEEKTLDELMAEYSEREKTRAARDR
jgi:hypothetical protein